MSGLVNPMEPCCADGAGGNVDPLAGRQQYIPLFSGSASTSTDSTTKRVVGDAYFDPTDVLLATSETSTASFEVLLATSAGANLARCDLLRATGAGAPVVVATINPTAATTATLLTADVSAAFRPSGIAGVFSARIWLTTNTGNDFATCTMARIRITP